MNTPAFTHLAAALVAENDEPPVDVERLGELIEPGMRENPAQPSGED